MDKGWIGEGERVTVSGLVHDVRWRFADRLYLFARDVRCVGDDKDLLLPGTLLVSVRHADFAPCIGQRFQADLLVRPVHSLKNPGCWDGEVYWARQGVYWRSYIKDLSDLSLEPASPGFFQSLRRNLRTRIRSVLPPGKGRGLTSALLLGDRSGLDRDTYEVLQRAGVVHSLALSGLHLGFMVFFGWVLARGIGRLWPGVHLVIPRPKLAVMLGIPLVLFYMWLGGWTPSLLRAGIMFGSWGALLVMNRSRVLMDGLCLAVLIILLWSPAEVFSISLQFSVLAVAGIILVVPAVQSAFAAWAGGNVFQRILVYGIMIMVVSVVANVAILPIQAWNFGTLTLHQYYNIIWIPLLGFVLLPLGFVGLFVSLVPGMHWLGSGALLVVDHVMGQWCDLLVAARDNGWLEMIRVVRPTWPELLGFYGMVLVVLAVWKRRKGDGRWCLPVVACASCLLVMPTMVANLSSVTQTCRVLVMDTGMSQAILVELPGNRRLLVDGGGSWSRDFDMGKAVVTPVLTWGRPPRIDKVFLTHSDCDHLRGLIHPLATCEVGGFYWNGRPAAAGWDRDSLEEVLKRRHIPAHLAWAGMDVDMGDGVRVEVLHPRGNVAGMSRNDGSLVLRIVVDGKGLVLIPGDIEEQGIEELLAGNADLRAELLILPHHGSGSSWSEPLYDRVNPRLAVAAAGWNNRYGFPAGQVVESLAKRGVEVVTTGKDGAVEVVWPVGQGGMIVHPLRSEPFGLP